MRNSLKVLLLGSLLSSLAHANPLRQFHCWDGTYAYNAASLVETDYGWEFGIKGYELGPVRFTYTWSNPVHIEESNRSRLFVAYKKNECVVSADESKIICEKSMIPNLHLAKFYIEQTVPNLDETVMAITPLGAAKIKVTYNYGTSIEVEFVGSNGSIEPDDIQKLYIPSRRSIQCGKGIFAHSVLFPEQLRAYLKQRKPGPEW